MLTTSDLAGYGGERFIELLHRQRAWIRNTLCRKSSTQQLVDKLVESLHMIESAGPALQTDGHDVSIVQPLILACLDMLDMARRDDVSWTKASQYQQVFNMHIAVTDTTPVMIMFFHSEIARYIDNYISFLRGIEQSKQEIVKIIRNAKELIRLILVFSPDGPSILKLRSIATELEKDFFENTSVIADIV